MSFNPYEAPLPADAEVVRDQRIYEFRSAPGLTAWASWWILGTSIFVTAAAVPIFILDPYIIRLF